MRAIRIMAIFCCLFSVLYTLVAQDGALPEERKWIMRRCNLVEPPMVESLYTAYIKGCSIINGYSYSKLRPGYTGGYNLFRKDGTKWYVYKRDIERDSLVFDESWNVGDTAWVSTESRSLCGVISKIGEIQGRKYWIMDGSYSGIWVEDVGFIDRYPIENSSVFNGFSFELICCVEPTGDTLYVNRDLFYMFDVDGITGASNKDVVVSQSGNECLVTLPEICMWKAALYSCSGVTVARLSGEGCEILLPTTSKGAHILVLDVGGKLVTKKLFIK